LAPAAEPPAAVSVKCAGDIMRTPAGVKLVEVSDIAFERLCPLAAE